MRKANGNGHHKPKSEPVPAAKPKRTSPALEYLPVPYSPPERQALGEQLARATMAKTELEEGKKARDAEYKDDLEKISLSIRSLCRKLHSGNEYRNVSCEWILEDPTPAEKSLVRKDTGELIRTVPMQADDYQEELPLLQRPTPVVGEEPLVLSSQDGKSAGSGDVS